MHHRVHQQGQVPPPLLDISEEDRDKIVEEIAQWIMKVGMGTPAILFLEAHKPLNRVAANLMHLTSPVAGILAPLWDHYGVLLQDKENLEVLISRLEELERERGEQERALRAERKKRARERRRRILGFDPDAQDQASRRQ